MCENELKPKLEPWKKRAPELERCSWNLELWSQSCVIFMTPQPCANAKIKYSYLAVMDLATLMARAWKNVDFPWSLSKFPAGRKLKTITPLWRRKRNLFSWKHCTQEPHISLRSHRSTWMDSAY